jgi:hypothetical protein
VSRTDVDDFLDRLDEVTAPACGTCARTLDSDGPSLYFCDDDCSATWHRTQGEPLVEYSDPWDRPDEFPGVGGEAYRPQAPGRVRGDSGIRFYGDSGVYFYNVTAVVPADRSRTIQHRRVEIRRGHVTPGAWVGEVTDWPERSAWAELAASWNLGVGSPSGEGITLTPDEDAP